MKIQTYLPIFPGFYNTIFEPDEEMEIQRINEERESKGLEPAEFDAFDFDYEDYRDQIARGCCSWVCNFLDHLFKSKTNIEFQEIWSPREYNFKNDSIYIGFLCDAAFLNEVRSYLEENRELFQLYLQEGFTSHSGFVSYFSQDINIWLGAYWRDVRERPIIIATILDFIISNEEEESEMSMYYGASENAYLSAKNYEELIKV